MNTPVGKPPYFFFNGRELPAWSAQWHLCGMDFSSGDTWDEFIGLQHLWHLECRIGHWGVIESEDPTIFRICAQEMLLRMISDRDAVLSRISEAAPGHSAEGIYAEIAEGIGMMLSLTLDDGHAFWTSGDDGSLASLSEFISRNQLPQGNPMYLEAPHVSQRRAEQHLRLSSQLKEMRAIVNGGLHGKRLRSIINQLA